MEKQCTSLVVMTSSYTVDEFQPNATRKDGDFITDVCASQLITNTGPSIYSGIASKGERVSGVVPQPNFMRDVGMNGAGVH